MKKILVANRGEIAARVAKAISELGYESVGIYSDSEREAGHLPYFDHWVKLDGTSLADTFLNIPLLVRIMDENKIDALHPGFGFLSENAGFVTELEKHGKIFIGPNSKVIELMGDKAVSKKIAREANVPTIPGGVSSTESCDEALGQAKEIGFPILLKAKAGGGGKGMTVCHSEEDIKNNFDSVKRQAINYFGDPGILVEKLIQDPHHIEVQILADTHGNVFHLFERECSIQRRHQKIIEEAPSPFIGKRSDVRDRICDAAVKLAKHVDYDSVGTVEFVMDQDYNFYFLEMNTRIQVEHAITEAITNFDLVREMIDLKVNSKVLEISQEDISFAGHAIEVRLCAESTEGFIPQIGKIEKFEYKIPIGVRFDHALYQGQEIVGDFDSMLGKVIGVGRNRDIARQKLLNVLGTIELDGVETNLDLLVSILKDLDFVEGKYNVGFLDGFMERFSKKTNKDFSETLIKNLLERELYHMGF